MNLSELLASVPLKLPGNCSLSCLLLEAKFGDDLLQDYHNHCFHYRYSHGKASLSTFQDIVSCRVPCSPGIGRSWADHSAECKIT